MTSLRWMWHWTMLAAVLTLTPAMAQTNATVKIGLITTLSGPGGVLGADHKDGAELALERLGGMIGGLPAEIIYGDDQQKPDVGRQLAESMIKRDQVNFLTGVVFSNVLLAMYKPIVDSGTIMVGASGGPHEIAGELCSPNFFSMSWQNDQAPEAMGKYMSDQKIEDVFIMAPNYAAGKDMLAGFKRTYQGKIVSEVYTNLTQPDYQAEISQIRAANPKAVFVFYPGGLGIQFVKQYAQAGLQGKIPLYSVYSQNELTLPALGEAAAGNYETGFYAPDLKNPVNEEFVAAFTKKYGRLPADYAASAYDAINLIDRAVTAVHGNLSDKEGMIAEMQKANIKAVRGEFKFNNNHFPIENFYLFKIEKNEDGKYFRKNEGVVMSSLEDSYASKCPMK
jgi:branched-chain amino acid transport system substrate-binding protein